MAARIIDDLRTPCLVCIKSIAEANASAMLGRAAQLGCALRPHVKTNKTLEASAIATGGSKRRIAVSTMAEAHFFAAGGFDDILYAVPITRDKVADALKLRSTHEFHVMVDSQEGFRELAAAVSANCAGNSSASPPLDVFVRVDCGYGREGVCPFDAASVDLVRAIASSAGLRFGGLYTHGGHSYDASDAQAVRRIGEAERDSVAALAGALRSAGLPPPIVGVGSTPTCSLPPADLDGVDEMHPGNFIYYDMMQARIGACGTGDMALRVLTRVLGHYPSRGMMLVDLGWTGVSSQGSEHGYGSFVDFPGLRCAKLKQECGEVVAVHGAPPIDFAAHPLGSILMFAPYHACAATQQHTHVHAIANDRRTIVGTWEICKGW